MSQREYKFDYPFQTYEDEMKRFRTHTDNPKIVQGIILRKNNHYYYLDSSI